jgi:hypothetical protein
LQFVINNANHACYMDKPDEFHKRLAQFLSVCLKAKDKEL